MVKCGTFGKRSATACPGRMPCLAKAPESRCACSRIKPYESNLSPMITAGRSGWLFAPSLSSVTRFRLMGTSLLAAWYPIPDLTTWDPSFEPIGFGISEVREVPAFTCARARVRARRLRVEGHGRRERKATARAAARRRVRPAKQDHPLSERPSDRSQDGKGVAALSVRREPERRRPSHARARRARRLRHLEDGDPADVLGARRRRVPRGAGGRGTDGDGGGSGGRV